MKHALIAVCVVLELQMLVAWPIYPPRGSSYDASSNFQSFIHTISIVLQKDGEHHIRKKEQNYILRDHHGNTGQNPKVSPI